MNRPRRVAAVGLSVLALAALSACASKPSDRQVVRDTIQSLQLPDEEEACMLARLENYSDDQLEAIANENENWDPAEGSTMQDASESMRLFIADYEECTGEGGAASAASQPTGSSEPTTSSGPSATSEPAPTTS